MKILLSILMVFIALGARGESAPDTLVSVPFDDHKNQVILAVKLNGHGPYPFILDTGVDPSIVDLGVVEEAGLPIDLGDENEADGVGASRTAVYPAELRDIDIGGHDFGDAVTAAMDMGRLEERMGRPFKGVLGFSFLQGKIVEIDYPGRTVSFLPETWRGDCRSDEEKTCFSFPLEPASGEDNMPKLQGVRASGVPLLLSMDTGSSGGFDLNPETLAEIGVEYEIAEGEEAIVTGARGNDTRQVGVLKNVSFGPFHLGDVEAHFETRRFGQGDYRQGNVGNVVFKEFIVTLDYRGERIIFRKPD
jgi:hypothetical protein